MALTAKRQRFCDEYLVDLNATQAAIRAGYSVKTAREQACVLLTKLNIQEYIQTRQAELSKKFEITQERVLAEYAKIGFSDIRKIFSENGEMRPIKDLGDDEAATIASIEVFEEFAGVGEEKLHIGNTKKIKLWDKKAALDSICKVLGFNAPEKKDITGDFSFSSFLMESGAIDE